MLFKLSAIKFVLLLLSFIRVSYSVVKASDRFPVLDEYLDEWATKDVIRGILKYTTVRERNLKHKRVSNIVQASVSLLGSMILLY